MLRNYLQKAGIMVRIRKGEPEKLPICALFTTVDSFTRSERRAQKSTDGYYWPENLRTFSWNAEITRLVSEEYCEALRDGVFKDKELPEDVMAKLAEAIPMKLDTTQRHWKAKNKGTIFVTSMLTRVHFTSL
jgi:hypothetical protein